MNVISKFFIFIVAIDQCGGATMPTTESQHGKSESPNPPKIFGKDTRVDKLILKNHIGYHFKQVVREVSQELFVSRRINVSTLLGSVQSLKVTHETLHIFCDKLQNSVSDTKLAGRSKVSTFTKIKHPTFASFVEAKARCEAKGMQLPEIYTQSDSQRLREFLRKSQTNSCFAGIQFDNIAGIHRYISTAYPVWEGILPDTVLEFEGNKDILLKFVTIPNARFVYMYDGRVQVMLDHSHVNKEKDLRNWIDNDRKIFDSVMKPIICEQKWSGFLAPAKTNLMNPLPGLVLQARVERSSEVNDEIDTDKLTGLKGLCYSVANQAREIYKDMSDKLNELFEMIDISVHLEDLTRVKRFPFLALFVFKTGFKLIWGLVGFLDKLRLDRKVDAIEDGMNRNKKDITELTKTVVSQSVSIKQLYTMHGDLVKTISNLNDRVIVVERELETVINVVEIVMILMLVQSHVLRASHSLNSGYDILKDIIHCSIMGQTSPLILPTEQLKEIQAQISTFSTGLVDTEFSNMQSIIVSDPYDPHFLLVIVNVAAKSRREVELIRMVAVPYYEGQYTIQTLLDYKVIILDQYDQSYSILTEQEETGCLEHRCYVSDVERKVMDGSCGIPQYYDKKLEQCLSERTITSGVFLRPMLPDGVLFSFRKEVQTQLFCNYKTDIRTPQRFSGTGVMQIPRGCILSVTDESGKTNKIKGQPVIRMLDVKSLNLEVSGPIGSMLPYSNGNGEAKINNPYGDFLNEHLQSVVKQVETVDSKIANHSIYIWLLIAALLVIAILTALIIWAIRRNSEKFWQKIYAIRRRAEEIARQLLSLEVSLPVPTVVPRIPNLPFQVGWRTNTLPTKIDKCTRQDASYINMKEAMLNDEREERIYSSTLERRGTPSIAETRSFYPNLDPYMQEALLRDKLEQEAEEVKLLMQHRK